ncbi:hypothetical protein, partial [Aeromonas sp. QDB17]|uniref:hypothetical protein n=1 Tax=Aeromonas sp. QDB17 TaxID=2990485 RepID=UPI0022DFC80D
MSESPLNSALRHFEAAEANLDKAEKLLSEIEAAIPSGIAFGENPEYETNCRNLGALIAALPKIDGWKPEIYLMELDECSGQLNPDTQLSRFSASAGGIPSLC